MEEHNSLLYPDDNYNPNVEISTTRACCSTTENSICWFNSKDRTGLICSNIVILGMIYTIFVVIYGIYKSNIGLENGSAILVLCFLSLWSHLKTMLSDPGAVPKYAHPISLDISDPTATITICGRCDGYKPPGAHHDSTSNRCISRMDHFCPWMNNAIGI